MGADLGRRVELAAVERCRTRGCTSKVAVGTVEDRRTTAGVTVVSHIDVVIDNVPAALGYARTLTAVPEEAGERHRTESLDAADWEEDCCRDPGGVLGGWEEGGMTVRLVGSAGEEMMVFLVDPEGEGKMEFRAGLSGGCMEMYCVDSKESCMRLSARSAVGTMSEEPVHYSH